MSLGILASSHPLAAVGAYEDEVAADSPSAFWVCDDGTGSAVTDSSGNGRDGIAAGGYAWSGAGLFSGATDAIDFAGTNGSVNLDPSGGTWAHGTTLTVEAVIKPDNVSSVRHIARVENRWTFYISSSGYLTAEVYGTSGGWQGAVSGATALSADTVYHVAFTVDGTAIKVYVNGSQDGSGTNAQSPLVSGVPGNRSYAGYGTRPSTSRFDGEISHLAIYPSALSAARIGVHHAATGL